MKKVFKNTVAFFLCMLMVLGAFPLSASAKTLGEHAQGDLISFGWYPQSIVTDSSVTTALGQQSAAWHSYGYYSGAGKSDDGNMTPSGYMEYTDVSLGAQKYRGVRFSQYRPYYTGFVSSAAASFQDENAYTAGNTYWFLWEPLQWRVLDPAAGLVLSETIIDSQPFQNFILKSGSDVYGKDAFWGNAGKTHYANNYAESSLRQWLNNDFYNIAFSAGQQELIAATARDNSAFSASYAAYGSAETTDKISLLSYNDSINTAYGFVGEDLMYDNARQTPGSDYAKCQGLYIDASSHCSRWWLRTARNASDRVCSVDFDGIVTDEKYGASNTNFGVRPACNLHPTSEVFQSDISEVGSDAVRSIAVKTNPTKMSYAVGETLDTTGLTLTATCNGDWTETVESGFLCSPTVLTAAGTQTITVSYRGRTTAFSVTVGAASHEHNYAYKVATEPGCESEGAPPLGTIGGSGR